MSRLANKPKNKSYNRNPTGKGGFRDNPQNINIAGAPKRGESLAETTVKLWNMTRDEAALYFGEHTPIGIQLKQLPANVPLKDVMSIRQIITLCNDADGRLYSAVGDRAEGKPPASLDLSNPDGTLKPDIPVEQIAQRVTQLMELAKQRKDAK